MNDRLTNKAAVAIYFHSLTIQVQQGHVRSELRDTVISRAEQLLRDCGVNPEAEFVLPFQYKVEELE